VIGFGPLAWIFLDNQVRRCPAGRIFLLADFGSQTRKHGCMPGATKGCRGLRAKLLHRWQGVTAELIAATGDQQGWLWAKASLWKKQGACGAQN